MKKSIFKLLIIGFIIITLTNCTTAEIPIVEPPVETVSYNADVKVIIDNNCVTCHQANGIASFLPLTNYIEVRGSAENGNLIARMNDASNPMPQSGLLSAEIRAIIDKWRDDGYLEN